MQMHFNLGLLTGWWAADMDANNTSENTGHVGQESSDNTNRVFISILLVTKER